MFFELNEEKKKMNYFKTFVTIDEADFMSFLFFQFLIFNGKIHDLFKMEISFFHFYKTSAAIVSLSD